LTRRLKKWGSQSRPFGAKAKLGVKAVKGGMKEGWVWKLPKVSNSGEDALLKNVSTFGTNEHLRGSTS
jgi:hypothetical protein